MVWSLVKDQYFRFDPINEVSKYKSIQLKGRDPKQKIPKIFLDDCERVSKQAEYDIKQRILLFDLMQCGSPILDLFRSR